MSVFQFFWEVTLKLEYTMCSYYTKLCNQATYNCFVNLFAELGPSPLKGPALARLPLFSI